MSCKIVCPVACRKCDILNCADRIAAEENVNVAMDKFLKGFHDWNKERGAFKRLLSEQEIQAKCAMRSDISCRHCHEEDCTVRLAPRRY
jgi:hypothetical protein